MKFRLSTRLIFSVVLIEVVMLSLLVWNSVRLISSSHAELLEQSVHDEVVLLGNSLSAGLATNDRATLLDVLSLLKNKKNLVYATVYNRNKENMANIGHIEDHHDATGQERAHDTSVEQARTDGIFDISYKILLAGQHLGTLHAGVSLEHVEKITAKTRLQNTAIALVELALSITITIFLGLFITRNLRHLEKGAQALVRGELTHRIPINSKDEIGDVARSFNQLAQHLDETRGALKREHSALERETRRLHTLLNGIDAVVWEAEPLAHRFTYVSQEAEDLLGYPGHKWLEPEFWQKHIYPDDKERITNTFNECNTYPNTFTLDYRMLDNSSKPIWVRDITTVELDDEEKLVARGIIIDITEQKISEEQIVHLAEHDSLTGLINRRRFQEELVYHIRLAERYQYEGALLFVDLDQFKYINDTLGHQAGDEYLNSIANQLKSTLREVDIIGRLGGDEFSIILPKSTIDEAEHVAQQLLDTLANQTDEITSRFPQVSASIGIVLFPAHGTTTSDLLAKADAAMYVAKEQGRGCYHVFSDDAAEMARMHAKIHWEDRIRHALENDRFVLHFQPIVNLRTGEVVHYEALLRMRGDNDELIPPGAFLDTAERFGLIREIDHWVLRTAIQTQAASMRLNTPVSLAVNLSGRHFGSSEVLQLVKEEIAASNADPSKLIFEVTETAAVKNISDARHFINSLHHLGVRFALDDFGVGYASFHYLKNLPVDFIKIDGSFVRNLHQDMLDQIFIRATTELTRGLGITAIAEFVENAEIVNILTTLGIELGQGFHIARPSPTFLEHDMIELHRSAHG